MSIFEYDSDAKVVMRLILRPGVSIGGHVHEEDEEVMPKKAWHIPFFRILHGILLSL